MNLEKVVVLLRGVSGCGKSTVAKWLANLAFEVNVGDKANDSYDYVCCADDYYIEKYGSYKWNPQEISHAHAYCREKFMRNIMADNGLIVVANTNTKESDFKYYIDKAKQNGYAIFSLVVENRHGGTNEHNVPEVALDKQEQAIKNSLKLR